MIPSSTNLQGGGIIFYQQFCRMTGYRLDPIANQDKRRGLEYLIFASNYPVYPLKKLVISEKKVLDEIKSSQTYIGLENIDGHTGTYVETQKKEAIGTALKFSAGQILFPKLRPYLNKTHFAIFDGICSTEFHVFTPKVINGRYLSIFLRSSPIVGITSLLMTGNTLPRLQTEDIGQLPIPVPPPQVQDLIADIWHNALSHQAKQLNSERKLLDSIDDILLEELGIPRQPEPQNTLESRIFRRNFLEITGGRFDPIANQKKRRQFEEAIYATRYPVIPLRKLVSISKTLVDTIAEGQCYLGLENINVENGEFIGMTDKTSVGTAIQFETGQILFPKLRPYLNKTHLATFSGICSTEFHVFTARGISADFLNTFLRSKAIVGITSLLMTGNTLPRLQMSDIEALPVPVPPYPVQKQICAEINGIRAKARALRDQARADLEKAKREIEELILGKQSGEKL